MKELQIESNLTVIKDAPHPFLGKQVWFDQMVDVTDAFFQRTLKKNRDAVIVDPECISDQTRCRLNQQEGEFNDEEFRIPVIVET